VVTPVPDNQIEKPQRPSEAPVSTFSITEFLREIDQLKGPGKEILEPVKEILNGLAYRVNPKWSWHHTLVLYGLIILLAFGLGILVWFGKITSDVFTFGLGLLIGIMIQHVKHIFPTKE
jgi:hypothetical protein